MILKDGEGRTVFQGKGEFRGTGGRKFRTTGRNAKTRGRNSRARDGMAEDE